MLNEVTKFCSGCDSDKPVNQFYLYKTGKYSAYCKSCDSERKKQYSKLNAVKINRRRKKYREENKEKIKQQKHDSYLRNKSNVAESRKSYMRKKRKDPLFKLRERISGLVWDTLRKNKNGLSVVKYLGYTMAELKTHIESQFEWWMTWDNWGRYDCSTWDDNDHNTWVWNIDHIIPQADLPYDSMKHENFKKCWALENLRPLSAKRNLLDGATRIRHTTKTKRGVHKIAS